MMIYPRITKLYMYKPPNGYTLDILREERLWAAKPKHFNDPFDCDLEVAKGITADDCLEAMRRKGHSQREIDKYVTADGNFTLEGQERADKAMQLIKDQRNMGILCLSEEWDSIRMWSHYAKDHTGVCFEFTRAADAENALGDDDICSPVNYFRHYPQIDIGQMLLNPDGGTIGLMMKTKSIDWSYEKEWRLITLQGDQKCELPGPISRVILGIRIEDEFKSCIEKLCKAHNIPCVQARKANREFRIVEEIRQHRKAQRDYWGDLQMFSDRPTPAQILKEQASVFNEKIGWQISATVVTSGLAKQQFRSTLAVTVPALDRYHLDIVTVIYPLKNHYPLTLSDDLGDEDGGLSEVSCNSEQGFRDALHRVLSSKRTTDTLNSLLSLTA